MSEEIDALRSMGFGPVSWLVLPRCLALVATLPLLTWIGDVLALAGGLAATTFITGMTPRAYLLATEQAITATDFLAGLAKTPCLALAIGLVACGQGLAARGGRRGRRGPDHDRGRAVHLQRVVVSALFTFFFALGGL